MKFFSTSFVKTLYSIIEFYRCRIQRFTHYIVLVGSAEQVQLASNSSVYKFQQNGYVIHNVPAFGDLEFWIITYVIIYGSASDQKKYLILLNTTVPVINSYLNHRTTIDEMLAANTVVFTGIPI